MTTSPTVAIIGLGYVGLPLAVAIAKHMPAIGFDIDQGRVDELKRGHDRTDEVDEDRLRASTLKYTTNPADMAAADMFIVTVPTPVDRWNQPDLTPVRAACDTVGKVLRKGSGAVVVFESTVYPGVTEDICGPLLEEISGLKRGVDFFLGYSPERINPGDREHTVDRITKVIAGETPAITERLAQVYGIVTTGGVFRAASIKVAEAAKVIENAQRDINIAFINEIAMIFQRLGISVYDVLEAAGTKWNFLNFQPGLVGGHCIGVDPFYLAECAKAHGHHPEIILAGRRINDGMGPYVADRVCDLLGAGTRARVLVLGLTFKENVPDLRNTKVVDIVEKLAARGHQVDLHDPLALPEEAKHHYGLDLLSSLADAEGYDCVIGAVPHRAYVGFEASSFARLLKADGLVVDLKGMWRKTELPVGMRRWGL